LEAQGEDLWDPKMDPTLSGGGGGDNCELPLRSEEKLRTGPEEVEEEEGREEEEQRLDEEGEEESRSKLMVLSEPLLLWSCWGGG